MKNYVLFIMAVFLAQNANAEEMSYGERMQRLQSMQHSRPNAENYLNSVQREQNEPVRVEAGDGGHFFMPVSINGKQIEMVADTGASSIFISYNDALALGINMGSLNFNVSYSTANGKIMAARTTAREIQVGSIVMTNVPITISQNRNNDMSLLGMDFFQRLSSYEVRNNVLTMYK